MEWERMTRNPLDRASTLPFSLLPPPPPFLQAHFSHLHYLLAPEAFEFAIPGLGHSPVLGDGGL